MKEIRAFLITIGTLTFYFWAAAWLTAPHAGELLAR